MKPSENSDGLRFEFQASVGWVEDPTKNPSKRSLRVWCVCANGASVGRILVSDKMFGIKEIFNHCDGT